MTTVLILGSAPSAVEAATWPRDAFDHIVAINNAHLIRADWSHAIYPFDFPKDRRPSARRPGQRIVTQEDFVPAMNAFGGFVWGGGTMSFTAAYWALHALRPTVLVWFGCDMVYPSTGRTHFYGTGTPDPLRNDITLRSLEAKSARVVVRGARQGCAVVNLSRAPTRLVAPRVTLAALAAARPAPFDPRAAQAAAAAETAAGYHVASGRYWEVAHRFSPEVIDRIDRLWLTAARPGCDRLSA